ncbi:MAG: carboxypeptidase regulatory-like domain-containing protein, partial [Nocardioidaceae bacterium]
TSQLATLAGRVADFDVVVMNAGVSSTNLPLFGQVVDAAAQAEVSVLFAGQWGGGAIGSLNDLRGDPETIESSFVPSPVAYVPSSAHPIFAGFAVGEPVELMRHPTGGNQQYLSFDGYRGTTIGGLRSTADGADLGSGVGYTFSSKGSVEVVLATLAAATYGYPGERWTGDAERIYLNAVAWAADAEQGSVTGTVTSDGAPVERATVTAVELGASTPTAEDGTYALGLPDGTHTVRVEAAGFGTEERSVTVSDAGQVTLDVELTALPRGDVSGLVSGPDGTPVAGAVLTATGPQKWEVTTDADGRYAQADLLEGDYQVSVTADGYLPGAVEATVVEGTPAVVDVTLRPLDVGVLGDADGALVGFLRDHGVAAGEVAWAAEPDLAAYDVVVVNGPGPRASAPDRAAFDALVAEADAEQVSVVYTGTWGVGQGGVRLLEQFSDRVDVGAQGYGEGSLQLTGFDGAHPLFGALTDPSTIVSKGGYYSVLTAYDGAPLAQLAVAREDADPRTGLAAAYSWRTTGSIELVLSASAVTGSQGPGLGWTEDGGRLVLNAVEWARDAALAAPAVPTLTTDETLTTADSVLASGTADWPSTVSVRRGGTEVGTAETGVDGSWSVRVPLVEGDNALTAVAANAAGGSASTEAVSVVRDTTGPDLDWQQPADLSGTFESSVTLSGLVTDEFAGVAELRLGDSTVTVAEDGSFSVDVPLAEGENVLALTAVDLLGNQTTVSRTVLRRDWSPRWQVPGNASTRPVLLWLEGAPTGEPAASAELVVTAADGSLVDRLPLTWRDDHYYATVKRLPRGEHDLTAVLMVDGYRIATQGPRIRVR